MTSTTETIIEEMTKSTLKNKQETKERPMCMNQMFFKRNGIK